MKLKSGLDSLGPRLASVWYDKMCYIKFSPMKIFSWEPTAFSKWLSMKSENRLGDVKLILSIWFFSRYEVLLTKYREFTGLNYRWIFENAIFHDFNVQKFHIGISASAYWWMCSICTIKTRYRFIYVQIAQYASFSTNYTVRIVQFESYGTHCRVRIVRYA